MNKRRILIVDDHPVNRRLPGMLLRDSAWECSEAESGEAALTALRQTQFDCVLLDISMPLMSGNDVCNIIRRSDDLKHLRVIAYTAHAFEEARNNIMAAGFNGILVKPITRKTLLAALEPERGAAAPGS
jgi:CheY-like chemotaxis protein